MVLKKNDLKELEVIKAKTPPVLSLYVLTNPADPDVAQYTFDFKKKPYVIRAKDTLKALGVPEALSRRVLDRLEHDAPQAVTRAIFAGEDFLEVYDLGVELPVMDLKTGLVEARWGEPYVAPLFFALDEFEPYAVVLLDQERWRLFEVFMNQIEEVEDAFRAVAPEEWRELKESAPAVPKGQGYAAAARGGAAKDKFHRRLLEWTNRFYKKLATELERFVNERGIERVILVGPEPDTKHFESFLSKALRPKVVGHVGAPGGGRVAPSAVLAAVRPLIAEVERAEEARLLDTVREKGIWGAEQVLRALQEGRVYLWVLPWRLDLAVYYCPEEKFAAFSEAEARAVCAAPERRPLKDLVDELAAVYGARLEFVRGEAEERLTTEFDGMAGLVRW